MNNPTETLLVIYLGIGAVFVFYNMEVIKRLIREVSRDAPNLPIPWVIAIVAIGLAFVICTWPIWAVIELVDWIKSKG